LSPAGAARTPRPQVGPRGRAKELPPARRIASIETHSGKTDPRGLEMKKTLVLLAALAYVATAALPAHAAEDVKKAGERWVFPEAGTIPCSVALTVDVCAYNTPASALGYRACENPFPEGSYYDVVTTPAPTVPAGKKMIVELRASPAVDWDTWICARLSNGSHDGGELAQGANVLGQLCDNFLGPDNPVPIGCIETADAPAEPGHQYVFRAYNYFDVSDCPAQYDWLFV
jgi:hypothetical protein